MHAIGLKEAYYCLLLAILKNDIGVDETIRIFEEGAIPLVEKLNKSPRNNRRIRREIAIAHDRGVSIKALSKRYSISERTICRYVAKEKDKKQDKNEISGQTTLFDVSTEQKQGWGGFEYDKN